ncbi:MAG TPA: TlpA disulfide reductase family protein [Gemmatimonadaceae bacterium]|jgi:Thiol-disulfide isomerase and thioredoxins
MNRLFGVVLALALSLGASANASAQIGIPVGTDAPGAAVHKLDGTKTDISQYIGKSPVLIEFWATWCPVCKELEPKMLDLAKRYGSQVKFLGVAVSVNESPKRVKLYADKYGYPYELVFDTDGNAVTAYDVPATSYIVVIDKSGKVVYTGQGADQDLEAALKKAL